MPTGTFFRLPEEKRLRLIEAAWEEFTRVPLGEASVNRIIRAANIPRGSFYQYFAEKKEDLLTYLLKEMGEFFFGKLHQGLRAAEGDVFALMPMIYDGVFSEGVQADQNLLRCIRLFRVNPEVMMRCIITEGPGQFPQRLAREIDTSRFYRRDEAFVSEVCILLLFSLGSLVVETLCAPEKLAENREVLRIRAELLRRGCERTPGETGELGTSVHKEECFR